MKYGNMAIWQYGNMAIWQYGNMAIWQEGWSLTSKTRDKLMSLVSDKKKEILNKCSPIFKIRDSSKDLNDQN
jgi:hypothetical protein